MGTCSGVAQHASDTHLTQRLERERRAHTSNTFIDVLVFGAKGAGRTTLLQQLQTIHDAGNLRQSNAELLKVIRAQCVTTMLYLLSIVNDTDSIHLLDSFNVENEEDLQQIGRTMANIWKRYNKFKRILAHSYLYKTDSFEINENIAYFMEHIERIMQNGDTALVDQDIINWHSNNLTKDSAIESYEKSDRGPRISFFNVEVWKNSGYVLECLPPPGYCVDYYNGLIFVAALSDYCSVLISDPNVNALQHTLDEFERVISNKAFQKRQPILFLNKVDIFRERLRSGISLSVCFGHAWRGQDYPHYIDNEDMKTAAEYVVRATEIEMECEIPKAVQMLIVKFTKIEEAVERERERLFEECLEESVRFIRNAFVLRNKDQNREIHWHMHLTQMTDQRNVEKVIQDCQNLWCMGHMRGGPSPFR